MGASGASAGISGTREPSDSYSEAGGKDGRRAPSGSRSGGSGADTEEINDSLITLEVDGTMVDPQLGSLRMSQDGQFMIPYGMLPDALSCGASYDGNRLVMERGNTHAEMTVGARNFLPGEESQNDCSTPEWENGILMCRLEAVTECIFL